MIRPDAPEALSTSDLSAAVSGVATTEGSTTASTAPVPSSAAATSLDGTWNVTEESEFGFRVEEVLFGVNTTAAGRSNEITGDIVIAGAAVESGTFSVDVASITSDEDRRDNQFRGRIMEVEQFPRATFTLTAPIDLGSVPAAAQQVTASAAGDLTLHGVTRSVTFDVTAEARPGRIGVLGTIPVVFADYEIDNPSTSGIHDRGQRHARVRARVRARLIRWPGIMARWTTCVSRRE